MSNLRNENEILKTKIISKETKIADFIKEGKAQDVIHDLNNKIEILSSENQSLKNINEKLTDQLNQILTKKNSTNNDLDEEIMKKNDEIERLKIAISNLEKEKEKEDEEKKTLTRENEKIRNQLIRLSTTLPEEFNDLQKQYKELETKYIKQKNQNELLTSGKKQASSQHEIEIKNREEKLIKELKEAKKQIDVIKKKNNDLVEQLEEKEIKNNFYDYKSEDAKVSNYEEEFDLRKMAKGAKEKNKSQDINIDYPGIQSIKEKYRELDFFYNSLETLVKKLLLTIQTNPKNKTYVTELCKMVGFDLETTNKIIMNKNKNSILGLFSK